MKPFVLVTDYSALKWLQTSKLPKGQKARWVMELQQYEFTIKYRSEKANINANALSRILEESEVFFLNFESTSENGYISSIENNNITVDLLYSEENNEYETEWYISNPSYSQDQMLE